jgi:hypothetical protein
MTCGRLERSSANPRPWSRHSTSWRRSRSFSLTRGCRCVPFPSRPNVVLAVEGRPAAGRHLRRLALQPTHRSAPRHHRGAQQRTVPLHRQPQAQALVFATQFFPKSRIHDSGHGEDFSPKRVRRGSRGGTGRCMVAPLLPRALYLPWQHLQQQLL